MESSLPPIPPPGSILDAIRNSSRRLREDSNIFISPKAIERLILSPSFKTSFKRVSASHGLALPLKFASHLDELNFVSILSLLNFASGYRIPLRSQTGRGAWDSIRALTFGLYISSSSDGDFLSAKGMEVVEITKIAELMGLNLYTERPHESLVGVNIGEMGGPSYELVKLITSVLNQTGAILVRQGYPNLGAFVAEALEEGRKARSDHKPDIELGVVVERLIRAFPAFQDMATVNNWPIYCFKKALFLVHAITVRFGSISPPPFPIPPTARSPVFSDNVLPSMLVYLGVIDLSRSSLASLFPDAALEESLVKLLQVYSHSQEAVQQPEEGPTVTVEQSYFLRAAAIDACELIVEQARSLDIGSLSTDEGDLGWYNQITLTDLDMWLWAVAKDRPDYRSLKRFVLTNTAFF